MRTALNCVRSRCAISCSTPPALPEGSGTTAEGVPLKSRKRGYLPYARPVCRGLAIAAPAHMGMGLPSHECVHHNSTYFWVSKRAGVMQPQRAAS